MNALSKVVLGLTGSVVAACVASYARSIYRSKEAIQILDDMEIELNVIRFQFNEADVSKIQAERMIDMVIDKCMMRYMHFTLGDKNMVRQLFESHRENNKKLLGIPA